MTMNTRFFLSLLLLLPMLAPLKAEPADSSPADKQAALRRLTESKRAVFRIFASAPNAVCSGTGFLISADGYIVTNRHVVSKATDITVYIMAEDELSATGYAAECVQEDADNDLAVLRLLTPPDFLPKPFALAAEAARVFDEVVSIGFPAALDRPISESADISAPEITDPGVLENLDPNITKGAVSKVGTWVIHDAKIAAGNSGGPLIDAGSGKVVGVNTAKTMGKEAFYLAVPVERVQALAEKIAAAHAAMQRLEALVAQGNAAAMAELGRRLSEGTDGYPLDTERALSLLEAAAEQGNKEALFDLGCVYTEGKHVKQDDQRAVGYFERCDSIPAKMQLFGIYAYGTDTAFPRNPAKAFEYAQALYDEGGPEGKALLAACYKKGIGVKKNLAKAVSLLQDALQQEQEDASYEQGESDATKLELAEAMLGTTLPGWHEDGIRLLESLALDKDSAWCGTACCTLAILYYDGDKVKKDIAAHLRYLRLGAEVKDTYCLANLAIAYLLGNRGVEQDLERGRFLATESVERGGDEKVYYYVGRSYVKAGQETVGLSYMQRALAAGSSMARNEMAVWHLTGEHGLSKDKQKAIRYLKESMQDREDEVAASVAADILKSISATPARSSRNSGGSRSSSRSGNHTGGGSKPAPQSLPKRNVQPW